MSKEQSTRSPEEIRARIQHLEKEIQKNDIWIHHELDQVAEPETERKRYNLKGRVQELQWALGEDLGTLRR